MFINLRERERERERKQQRKEGEEESILGFLKRTITKEYEEV